MDGSDLDRRIALASEDRVIDEATERARRLEFGDSVLGVILKFCGNQPTGLLTEMARNLGLMDPKILLEKIQESQEEVKRCAEDERGVAAAAERSRSTIENTDLEPA